MKTGPSAKNRILIRLSLFLVAVSLLICMLPFIVWAVGENEPNYIYFDLSAGNVSITGSSYVGYRFDGSSTATKISGTFADGDAYYVYQSDGNVNTGLIDGVMVLPEYAPVTYGGQLWGDYVTNNSAVETVIGAWLQSPENQTRVPTPNYINVTGRVNCVMVIDSLWSSFHVKDKGRVTGGIGFEPTVGNTSASKLTLQTVGDNRFGNISYVTRSYTTHRLIIEEKEAGSTLTVANLKKNDSKNYWSSAIGSSDNTDHSRGIVINSGTVWAGTNAADDCTAIGAGGNGFGEVTINGGRVTASVVSSGAAIGGGIGKTAQGGAANVTITGGSVYAYNASCSSGSYSNQGVKYIPAAAIGGGSSARVSCNACTVSISGGYVYAQSVGGTAIGGGSSADSDGGTATVNITGGTVVAKSIAGYINGMSVPAGNAIGGGTGGKKGNGGNVTLNISGDTVLTTGSIGGGSTIGDTSVYKIGSATIEISGGTISGQLIMAEGASKSCSFNMSGGVIDNGERDEVGFVFLQENGGAIYMDDSKGVATLSGGSIKNCTAKNGGAIYMTAGKFTLSDAGSIDHCSALEKGGAVYLGGGTLNVDGGTVTLNEAVDGGFAYLTSGTMNITGGEIKNSSASNHGGAAYLGGGTLNIGGGILMDNEAIDGGFAYLTSGTMNITGGEIKNNSASNHGGAVYLGGGTLNVGGGILKLNEAINGGAAYVANGKLYVSGGEIVNNTATNDGGAAFVDGGNVYVSGGTVASNVASNNGGGFSIQNGNYEMSGGAVDHNTATNGSGGAIYIVSESMDVTASIFSGSVTKNYAGQNGGAMALLGSSVSAVDARGSTTGITVTLGVNEHHEGVGTGDTLCDHNKDSVAEINGCPVIKDNSSSAKGGAIYISGTENTEFNAYCLTESGSAAGEGFQEGNFMMVEGGSVVMSTAKDNNATDGEVSTYGSIVINEGIHVTGGKMEMHGSMSNPLIKSPVTVDILDGENHSFDDERVDDGSFYRLQYFENFQGSSSSATGQYKIYQVAHGESLTIVGVIYSNHGYYIDGWYTNKEGTGYKYEVNKPYTFTNSGPENPGSLKLYAHWKRNGYQIIFDPGTSSYGNSMPPQDFTYNVGGNLNLNKFTRNGFIFTGWKEEIHGTPYTDGQYIYNLTDVNDAKFTFIAQWIPCTHTDGGDATYRYEADGNVIHKRCSCNGFHETLTIMALNGVYSGDLYLAWLMPEGTWDGVGDEDIVYTSGGIEKAPRNAGSYTASITYKGATASIAYVIDKAIPPKPNKPSYIDVDNGDGTSKSVVVTPNALDIAGKQYQYRVSYYQGETPIPLGWQNESTISLPVSYTNYVVYIRYAEDENYYESEETNADYVFYYSEDISISIDGCDGFLCLLNNIEGEGLHINLIVQDGYYKSGVTFQMYAITKDGNGNNYANGAVVSADYQWLQNIPSGGVYAITLVVRGAKECVDITSDATEGEKFGIWQDDGIENKISNDSSLTVDFLIEKYHAYRYPAISFGSSTIPAGTSIIMIDKLTGTYWYYVATASTSKVLLTDFTRMGGTTKYAEPTAQTQNYRFVIDFSDAESTLDVSALSVSFTAERHTAVDSCVPTFTENAEAFVIEEVTFSVDILEQEGLEAILSVVFAETNGVASKWNDRVPVLVLMPEGTLPPDVSLRVTEGNRTGVYSLITDSHNATHELRMFIVPLNGTGDDIKIVLESTMFSSEGVNCRMDVALYASDSVIKTSPMNGTQLVSPSENRVLSFTAEPTNEIAIDVFGDETLISAGQNSVLTVGVRYDIPEQYTIKAEIRMKDANGNYIGMGWSEDDIASTDGFSVNEDGSGATYTVGLGAFQTDGSYALMLSVVDRQGVVITTVPFYFVIYHMN